MELTIGRLTFDRVEMRCHKFHTARVANEDDTVGQLFGAQVKVKHAAVIVDDEFGGGEIVFHGKVDIRLLGHCRG